MKTPQPVEAKSAMGQEQLTDDHLLIQAVEMYANWIQTGNPILSASDARAMGKPELVRVIDSHQQDIVVRLRSLAGEIASFINQPTATKQLGN